MFRVYSSVDFADCIQYGLFEFCLVCGCWWCCSGEGFAFRLGMFVLGWCDFGCCGSVVTDFGFVFDVVVGWVWGCRVFVFLGG